MQKHVASTPDSVPAICSTLYRCYRARLVHDSTRVRIPSWMHARASACVHARFHLDSTPFPPFLLYPPSHSCCTPGFVQTKHYAYVQLVLLGTFMDLGTVHRVWLSPRAEVKIGSQLWVAGRLCVGRSTL